MSGGAGRGLAVGFEGPRLPDEVARLVEEADLAGVVLFKRNCPSLDAVLELTSTCRRIRPDLLVLVDHEGGRVHRLPPPFTHFPAAAVVGRTGDPALAGAVAGAMARELRAAGFDSGLTPVVDCLSDPRSTAIGDRAYGPDPELVAACGAAFVTAALAEGLLPVAKHFPGHGRTAVDSHLDLPTIPIAMDELARVELLPFERALAAGCPAVMVAHLAFPALDPAWPASLSPAVIEGLLRGRLSFDGLVVSDDLEMQAVARTWGVAASAVRFLEAGGDLALVCRDDHAAETVAALDAAVAAGRLSLAAAAARQARFRTLGTRPRPAVSVIGCAEHTELAEEIVRRAAPPSPG